MSEPPSVPAMQGNSSRPKRIVTSPGRSGTLPGNGWWCIALASAVVLIDLLTKAMMIRRLELGRNYWLVDRWIGLERTENRGIAFGLVSGSRWVSLLVVAAIAAFGIVFSRSGTRARPLAALALAAMAGGAIGNLIDRLGDGAVTDFLVLGMWPRFNVADAALTGGIAWLLWSEIVATSDSAP